MHEARELFGAIGELIIAHRAGSTDERSLDRLRELCRAAAQITGERDCAEALAAIEEQAGELFCACGSGIWVRHRMLKQLERCRARALTLLATREAAKKPRLSA